MNLAKETIMLRCFYALVCLLITLAPLQGRQLTLVVYNVENLFDADGVALYGDYQPDNDNNPAPYSPRKTLTKIQNITKVLQRFNNGEGPEIILFQEFELDRTPESTVPNYATFLEYYKDTTVDLMLTEQFDDTVKGLPVDALILKYFEDHGLKGYHVALPAPLTPFEDSPAHTNVVFTKFPITYEKDHPTPSARVIQEVGIDVDGSELIVFNNHWKSGASSPRTEPKRVQNARDLRAAVEAVLARNPQADVLIGGDLNTYYNAPEHFPKEHPDRWSHVQEFSIAELGSQGNEKATRDGKAALYNLWFELPEDQRGSELYRGYWGTLMEILITPGLYNGQGLHYVDNSFRVIAVPGLNSHGPWHEPQSWHFMGETGGGFSDHYPIAITLSTDPEPLFDKPSNLRANAPNSVPTVDYTTLDFDNVMEFSGLVNQKAETLSKNMGEVYAVTGVYTNNRPSTINVNGHEYELYSPVIEVKARLGEQQVDSEFRFIGQLGEYQGKPQFVIHDISWIQ
ncbi:endonuclease/exonuclease/phosphatase family protein [Cerasicoccus maritimus]|uniref:endonuclease/exonuclease/phosphatase family protein n=1 Tax=Cerasicoccus maritimus TaxID=490089 RepID=UPI0028524E0F|nr:endonuclease/exonuclease/phosphatase family protein [Cerasicoccus maritimus]